MLDRNMCAYERTAPALRVATKQTVTLYHMLVHRRLLMSKVSTQCGKALHGHVVLVQVAEEKKGI